MPACNTHKSIHDYTPDTCVTALAMLLLDSQTLCIICSKGICAAVLNCSISVVNVQVGSTADRSNAGSAQRLDTK